MTNWNTALEHNIWGTHAAHKESWEKLQIGDLLFFYVTRPVSGLIGIGITNSKSEGTKPLWQDEIAIDKVKYPYRWNFKVLFVLDDKKWNNEAISLKDQNFQFYRGINPIFSIKSVEKLKMLVFENWGIQIH